MRKSLKASIIHDLLNNTYPNVDVPLKHRCPFTLLVAVLLSQQSTDKKVNEITPFLFDSADSPKKMVLLGVDEIQKIIRPIGLSPQKAKNITSLSKMLLENFKGEVPPKLEELMQLPGVGRKTALCVLAQAFGHDAFPVDTHILRLANRWGLSSSKNPLKVEEDLKKLFPKSSWSKVHLQIIFAGREFCRASPHDPKKCPFCSAIKKPAL
ncbi:MAG: endonuclease III [Chlamydiae bacterium]|nr:endonuclease III [Chlamydiota bacterium]